MKKKIFKIIGLVLIGFILLLVAAPFLLKGKIADIIKEKVNQNVNATLDFADADLSLFSNFPNAQVTLQDISLINKAPFEGDTLFASKEIELKLSINELFKDASEPIEIKSLSVDGALLNIKVDAQENANYDIGKPSATVTTSEPEKDTAFTLAMESYELLDADIVYHDMTSGIRLDIADMNHSGTGDLSLEKSTLSTTTNALVSFTMDSTNYLNKHKIKLDALIGVDLKESTYSFLKNEALINQLPLVFDGFIKLNDTNQEIDINFKTPSSDFKNFLAVIPETYSKNIENVKTSGNFSVKGTFNGIVDDTHIPQFNIAINSDNASFKYPDLPKSVSNVFIAIVIANVTGITEDTFVDIKKLSFMIDEDKFNMSSKITELLGNTYVNAHIDGKMNLANISKAYPVPEDLDLKGILNADITTAFAMESVEKHQYENTKTNGTLVLKDFEYNSEEISNPIQLNSTSVTFNPSTVTLNELNGTTGKTDFNATGTIDNLLGFLFNDEKVEGNFDLKSNMFVLDDFMVEATADVENDTTDQDNTASEEKIKIPSFLDANINANANTVVYDNLTLKDVKGNLKIKDEKAILSNMTSSMLGGKVAFGGEVSTKDKTPTFAMTLGMDQLGIGETFKSLELFKVLAPIASALKGKLDSDIEISGNLTDDFTPDLNSISGKVLAELLAADIDPSKAKLLSGLSSQMSFLKLDELDLKGLKTVLSFEDGKVNVKPFTVNYQDIAVNVAGSHTFNSTMDYRATVDVPAKYLGNDVNALIAKIDDDAVKNLTIPVTANIGGVYDSPTVSTDLSSGVKTLTAKLVEIQKQKLIDQGKNKVESLIGDVLGGTSSEKDSVQKNTTEENVKGVLGSLLGGSKKAEDSTKTKTDTVDPKKEEVLEEKAKSILGGLLGGKKKKKKDSVD